MKILVVDYGLGNLRSVAGAIERLGYEPLVSSNPEDLKHSDKIILPGVGAFGDGMANLRKGNWIQALEEEVLSKKKPVLGICLGAQLITKSSSEFGRHEGLGWIEAKVERIQPSDSNLRVPHVGWNELKQTRECVLFKGIPDQSLFYFVHSYWIQSEKPQLIAGTGNYGGEFIAVFQKDNIYGTQFHPEKSQLLGLEMLRNFVESASC